MHDVERRFIIAAIVSLASMGSGCVFAQQNDRAVEVLRQSGQYESLRRAFGQARHQSQPAGVAEPATDPWTQQQELILSDGAAGDEFGFSVSLNGDTAIIGATGKYDPQAAAYVFIRSGTEWTQQAELTPSEGTSTFGRSVALNGDTAVITAGTISGLGVAYIFTRSGTIWTQQAELTASDAEPRDGFGDSMSLSGDTLVVGAWFKNDVQGASYVFTRSGTTWTQEQKLTAPDGASLDQFGYSVSIDGDTAVISAPSANHHQRLTGFGGAYVFTRSGTTWTHRQTLTASESADLDTFGWAVSLSRDTVIVSMSGKRSSQGVVFVFTRSENFWTQQAMLTASDGAGRDVFGSRLSLDGDTAAIVSTQTLFIPGAVYLFNRSGTTWTQQQRLTDFDSTSVSLSGDTGVIGAWQKNLRLGAAFVFTTASVPVTIASEPTGLGFSVTGAECQRGNYTTPQTLKWRPASACAVKFTSPRSAAVGSQSVFTGWADTSGSDNSRTIIGPDSATTYTVNFKTQYQLTAAVSPSGAGNATGADFYDINSSASVTASPNSGYLFAGWIGPVTSATSPSTTVVMSGPQSVTANFVQVTTTTVSPASGHFGDSVKLAAVILPLNAVFTGSLQFQVDGVNAGRSIPLTGGGVYSTTYTISNAPGAYAVSAVLTSTTPMVLGNSGTNKLTVNAATTAVAGPKDVSVTGRELQLDGTRSISGNGDPLSYQWTIPQGSPSAAIFHGTTATPTVQFGQWRGLYVFQLTVIDSAGRSAPDLVTVNYLGN